MTRLEFYAQETLGAVIGHTTGLERANFNNLIGRYTLNLKALMDRTKLLDIVQKNKIRHEEMCKEAIEGFKTRALKALTDVTAKLEAGDVCDVNIHMPCPEDHTQDYARAIAMLEMTEQDIIELDEGDFAKLVQDEWDWAENWVRRHKCLSKTISNYASEKGW